MTDQIKLLEGIERNSYGSPIYDEDAIDEAYSIHSQLHEMDETIAEVFAQDMGILLGSNPAVTEDGRNKHTAKASRQFVHEFTGTSENMQLESVRRLQRK